MSPDNMTQPNRAQRRQAGRASDDLVIPMGGVPNLGALPGRGLPEMPTLGEQRRSAAMQLAVQGVGSFDNAADFVAQSRVIEQYLVGFDQETENN